jgi:uncharacterized membrane protein
MPTAILFYDVVLSVHIAAILLAFGVTFAYPILGIFVASNHPRSLAVLHQAQERLGKFLITPFATIALIAGIYLASDRDYFSEVWVTVPMVILIGLLGLGGAFFSPQERKAAALAERDIAASGHGDVALSSEYEAVSKRIAIVGTVANVLILVAIFFMTAKPFA